MPAAQTHAAPARNKRRKDTPSKNRFRFETFNQRLASLTINPVTKARARTSDAADATAPSSHFVASFEKWRDLNLSAHFVEFSQKAGSLCESLPQILHHEDRLVNLLVQALETADSFSLEPLLELTSSLAHDIGYRFERHFPRVLSVILSAAVVYQEVEVIEWSFSALAWLFKYLSRLLVPDIRPTFDAIAPYLGKTHRKPHIARFAAEALSFLIRKAASRHDISSLRTIVQHILQDLSQIPEGESDETYQYGLMNLFANSIKGIDEGLHSSGLTVFETLLSVSSEMENSQILVGVFINLNHHARPDAWQPVLEKATDYASRISASSSSEAFEMATELLFRAATVRDGMKISNWTPLLESSEHLLILSHQLSPKTSQEVRNLGRMIIAVLAVAPLGVMIPYLQRFMKTIQNNARLSTNVCIGYFQKLNSQRLEDLVLPHVGELITERRNDGFINLILLHMLLPSLHTKQLRLSDDVASCCLEGLSLESPPQRLESWSPAELNFLDVYLETIPSIPLDDRIRSLLIKELDTMVVRERDQNHLAKLVLGNGLRALLKTGFTLEAEEQIDRLLDVSSHFLDVPNLLDNLRTMSETRMLKLERLLDGKFLSHVEMNLKSTSHQVRYKTLDLLKSLRGPLADSQPDVIEMAISIEELFDDAQATRKIAMYMRQMSALSEALPQASWQKMLTCYFCCGMMCYQLADVWSAAIEGLKSASASKAGEAIITSTISEWLAEKPRDNSHNRDGSLGQDAGRFIANEFQCFKSENAKRQFEAIYDQADDASYFEKNFNAGLHDTLSHISSRTQALRVLKGIPQFAERRSRYLVPLFLEWTNREHTEADDEVTDNRPQISLATKADLLLFLEVFALFQNPRTLFRSVDVYKRLLELVSNSNFTVQKRALDAILTWKQSGVLEFSDPLHRLLDDSRFREELMHMFQSQDIQNQPLERQNELMPVLLNLLFGRMTTSLKSSGSSTQRTRRRAVLECFHKLENVRIEQFLSIAARSVDAKLLQENGIVSTHATQATSSTFRRLLGLLKMIKDMLSVMGERVSFLTEEIMGLVLLSVKMTSTVANEDDDLKTETQTSLPAAVRAQGLQCLVLAFERLSGMESHHQVDGIFELLITPRIEKLAPENAQSVSHLFELFSVWAESAKYSRFLTQDSRLLHQIGDVLRLPFSKEEVKIFVLDKILTPVLLDLERSGMIKELQNHQSHFISCCDVLLRDDLSRRLLASAIRFSLQLASYIVKENQACGLLDVLLLLIEKPPSQVMHSTRANILELIQKIMPFANLDSENPTYLRLFDGLSNLLGSTIGADLRLMMCSVLQILTQDDKELNEVSAICYNLNAISVNEIDCPDFEKRNQAINKICSDDWSLQSARQWTPVLQNLMFFTKAAEDFDVNNNARLALCDVVSKIDINGECLQLIPTIILPALRGGVRSDEEQIRKNCLDVMARIVRCHPQLQETSDMGCLLMNNDEEASIFNNLFHLQQHRRIRALRRLASAEVVESLRSKNVAQFLIPLLEHLIFDRDDDAKAGDLAAESVSAVGALACRMEWPQARALLRRYSTFISSKPGFEKTVFRLQGVLIDAIIKAFMAKESTSEEELRQSPKDYPLMLTISRREKLSNDFTENLLPSLVAYLHEKDESVVSLRAPVAVSVAKLLMVLPPKEIALRLPPMLTDICHILRSRSLESRELVRKTLAEISLVVGSEYFGFIVKELHAALPRGYQLHVLSYTVHALLLEAMPSFKPGDLDYCVEDLTNIIMDDIFGVSGREKDEEDYSGKMKEVKSRKSFDSMELLASKISIQCLGVLIRPIQALLCERLDLKTVRKADELLRRFAAGLVKNEAVATQQSLVFCYELLQSSYSGTKEKNRKSGVAGHSRFLINVKGKKAAYNTPSSANYDFKVQCFAFDLVRMLVQKIESLRTPANLAGFLPALGDAMLKAQDEVQVSAMRLLAAIIKVPLPKLDQNGVIYLAEAVKIIKNSGSLNTELVQAAFKLVTAYLRERSDVMFKDDDIAQLLKIAGTELDHSETQGMVFNFLKSVLGRSIVIPEVYEFMDNVATIMVTHMSRDTRAMARATYLQFLLNYPQGSKRLQKQISFLRSNLQYPYVEGRQAIMEALHILLSRVDRDLWQEIVNTFFNPLVLVLVNDDSPDCRKMAGLLLESVFKSATQEQTDQICKGVAAWLSQTENIVLRRAGFQIYGILTETASERIEKDLPFLRNSMEAALEALAFASEETSWELMYYALQLMMKMLTAFRGFILAAASNKLWKLVHQLLAYPHKWVKTTSAKLIEAQLSDLSQSIEHDKAVSWPLRGSHGLAMSQDQSLYCAKRLLKALQSPELSEELADQLIRDLVILVQISKETPSQDKDLSMIDGDSEETNSNDGANQDPEDDSAELDEHDEIEGKAVLESAFRGVSLMIRQEPTHNKASALIPRGAALRLCSTLCNGLPASAIRPFLPDVMLPLYHLVDPSIPTPFSIDEGFQDAWREQVSSARDIMDALQDKIGAAEFLKESSKIQARVRERRNERRAKRKLAAVMAPERMGREKQRKGERKKQRRKEKGMEFRERRRGW